MEIHCKYEIQQKILTQNKDKFYYPLIDGVITNPVNKKSSGPFETFLIDTGAALNIIHPKWSKLFENTEPIDKFFLVFGQGEKSETSVYKVNFTFEGNTFESFAALPENFNPPYSILGYLGGLNLFDIFVGNVLKKQFKLIKKDYQ